jgi:predicted extracellular nuclease
MTQRQIWGCMNVWRKSKRRLLVVLTLFLLFYHSGKAQKDSLFQVMFYNTENLFDCFNDSLSDGDDEYLPDADRHWTYSRYKDKLNKTAKVIMAAGQWSLPAVVGLCEVENGSVVRQLLWWTGLGDAGYRAIHFESADSRGIDVALLYRYQQFKPVKSFPVRIELPDHRRTRDILVVQGVVDHCDTIWVMVNHWPSRLGGAAQSGQSRYCAAQKVVDICDSIYRHHPSANIIVMGDFNDTPTDSSTLMLQKRGLINLAAPLAAPGMGTNKYKQQWSLIDQVFLSQSYLKGLENNGVTPEFRIVDFPFLLEKDEANLGEKPFRTFTGPVYHGGFSDHLPVMLTLKLKQ